jgi:hypothetical protein
MADVHALKSTGKCYNCVDIKWDDQKIKNYVMSKSIAYDGKRMSWCDGFETLQDFIQVALGLEGKWRSYGGSSKKFDAKSNDFVAIWYPGKLNTLTLNGLVGTKVKEYLIDLCIHPFTGKPEKVTDMHSYGDLNETIDSALLEIEILKTRVDSVQSVITCADQPLLTSASLSSEIARLQIDLEEEKLKRCVLELQVNRLEEELNILKSYQINPQAISHAFPNHEDKDIEFLHNDESANPPKNLLFHQQIANVCEYSQDANLTKVVEENNNQSSYNTDPIYHNEHEQSPPFDQQLEDYRTKHYNLHNNNRSIPVHSNTRKPAPIFDQQIKEYRLIHQTRNMTDKGSHNNDCEYVLINRNCDSLTNPKRVNHLRVRRTDKNSNVKSNQNEKSGNETARSLQAPPTFPFRKVRCVEPSYRTASRHHSLEWLAHLHTVSCLTSQHQATPLPLMSVHTYPPHPRSRYQQ